MKNKLYMFDLDGTICDTNKVNYLAYKQALKEEGYVLTLKYFKSNCIGRNYLEFIPPISSSDPDFLKRIHTKKKKYYKSYLKYAKLNNELIEFIKNNKKIAYISLNTTASRENCMDILNHFKITNLFDVIVTKEDVIKVKPDPECYMIPMKLYGLEKEDCEIFEDSECGIKTAINAGIKYNKVSISSK